MSLFFLWVVALETTVNFRLNAVAIAKSKCENTFWESGSGSELRIRNQDQDQIQDQDPPCVELEEGGEPTLFIPDAQILQNKLIIISNIPDAQVTVKQTNFTTKSDAPVLQEQNKVLISIYLKIIANLCCIELLNSGRFRWTLLTSGATWV